MVEKNEKKISASFEENITYMNQILPVKESFDIIRREIEIGGRSSVFYYIDGFVKDEAMLKIMDSILSVEEKDMPEDAEAFARKNVPYVEVDVLENFDQVLRNVLSGAAVLFIDGYSECVCIDCRTYPARSVDEPDKDKSLRGSRDGFVETIVFNTALIRRRIRDPSSRDGDEGSGAGFEDGYRALLYAGQGGQRTSAESEKQDREPEGGRSEDESAEPCGSSF